MSEMETTEEDAPAKASKFPLLIGLVLALAGAAGGFFAVSTGMILNSGTEQHDAEIEPLTAVPDVAFVPIEPLTISLRQPAQAKHLRFRAQIEVPSPYQADVEKLLPRIVDVLNGYLRALDVADFEDPTILTRLRAQMLRRIQIVAGRERVNDLLIMEFVLN